MEPEIKGHEKLNLPTFAFYIHNRRLDQHILFDNGARSDWWNTPPAVVKAITTKGVSGLDIQCDVYDILKAGGVNPEAMNAVILSHYHWDHIGNIGLFPTKTDLIVGPGFSTLQPGYPAREDAPFHQHDLDERNLREINFDNDSQQIGPFQAYDYFKDGSLYLLNTPGHTVGHISALVRTTPTTFVFLGGDVAHFPGMFRPTQRVPLPKMLPVETVIDSRFQLPCPCDLFTVCHHEADEVTSRTTPFYRASRSAESWHECVESAQESLDGVQELDADENVFVAVSHDPALREVPNFPTDTLNDWKKRGWGRKLHWNFLSELRIDMQPGKLPLVEGLLRDGVAMNAVQ